MASVLSARLAVKHRDAPWCGRCGAVVTGDGVVSSIHHRKLRSQGGKDTMENMVLLCGDGVRGCHGWAHSNPKAAVETGWIVRSHADPAIVPVRPLYNRGIFLLGLTWTRISEDEVGG